MVQNNKNNQPENIKEVSKELGLLKGIIEDVWASIPIPLCSTDAFFNILKTGHKFREVFGYSEEEIVGNSLKQIFPGKEEFERFKQTVLREKRIEGQEEELVSKEGREILSTVYVEPRKEKSGEIVGYIFSFLDISEKKRFESELQTKVENLQKFTHELKGSREALLNILEDIEEARGEAETEKDKTLTIITSFPEGLLFFDKENRLSSLNPKARELFLLSSEETVLGKTLNELQGISSFSLLLKELGDDFTEKEDLRKEISLREDKILEVSVIGVMRGREKVGTLVVLRDITREKTVERLKTEFVSIAAHQLRTPLSAIKWVLKMMLDGDVGKISAEQKEFLEKAYESNERMIHLINDLLNVTRIEEGRFLYNVEEKDIIKIAEQTVDSFKDFAAQKGLKLEFRKPKEKIPLLKIDSEKISLVFQNLIANAVEYTDRGGSVEVSVGFAGGKKEIVFSVKDTGIGIPKAQRERVFSRFFRGSNAIQRDTEGTGLGLYISKNIVEAHGGRIWFETEENKGSTFFFTLPVSQDTE